MLDVACHLEGTKRATSTVFLTENYNVVRRRQARLAVVRSLIGVCGSCYIVSCSRGRDKLGVLCFMNWVFFVRLFHVFPFLRWATGFVQDWFFLSTMVISSCLYRASRSRRVREPDGFCCDHEDDGFLAWHRLNLVQMEEVLGEALPYWDWTETDYEQVSDFWRSGAMHRMFGRKTRRGRNINMRMDDLRRKVDTALSKKHLKHFTIELKDAHNSIHTRVGGDMKSLGRAAYDPIFYLHHNFIDYLFAFWQELQKLRNSPVNDLAPQKVHEPFSWRNNTNQVKYTQNCSCFWLSVCSP